MTTMHRRRIFKFRHESNAKYYWRVFCEFLLDLAYSVRSRVSKLVWAVLDVLVKHWSKWGAHVFAGAVVGCALAFMMFLGICQNGCAV